MNILILSRNKRLYSTKRLFEEAAGAGHNTAIVDYMHCNIISEKENPVVYYNGQSLRFIDALIPRIGATFTFYGAALIRQFEMQNIATATPSDALLKARDKLHCLQALTRKDVGMPKTYFTHYFYNIDEIITAVGGFPFVMKQLEGAQGNGVFLIKNRKHATEIINIHQSANKKFIIQEYIAESRGADIRAFVVGNKVVAAMKRQAKNGEFRSNLHQGGRGIGIKLTAVETATAIKSAKAMGLGVAGVDMLQSKRGPLVLEVNASPGLEGIEKTTKVNVAREIIKYIEVYI
ncbi:Ribosomal protein S6--L-glutamate ligase [hydrothermal vent metagenome]|uniref:Ribosomal protein S6--L-glutamate ligase n=1 Tax=hydrothermal vent metagenome TaxID=652676 RepID=A0A3B0UVH2_9ZZZZ